MSLLRPTGECGLRDYGTGTWEGGDAACDHAYKKSDMSTSSLQGAKDTQGHRMDSYKQTCGKCGAKRIDQQLGSEPSPDCGTQGQAQCGGCFVCSMVAVFRGVRRVLRDDGTCWINLGDTYGGGKAGGGIFESGRTDGRPGDGGRQPSADGHDYNIQCNTNLKPGNLVGVPWRVALALQADGWVLRSDIPWVKRSAMPESVTNRPTKALEYVFLLTKKMGYFYDSEAVRVKQQEPHRSTGKAEGTGKKGRQTVESGANQGFGLHNKDGKMVREYNPAGRNFRNADLWFSSVSKRGLVTLGDDPVGLDVTSESYEGAHYACFGKSLIEPMIKAGTSERGCCARCGSPWKRVVEEATGGAIGSSWHPHDDDDVKGNFKTVSSEGYMPGKTVGWMPGCGCDLTLEGNCQHCGVRWSADKSRSLYQPEVVSPGVRNVDASRQDKMRKLDGKSYNESQANEVTNRDNPCECFTEQVMPCTVLDPFIGSGTTAVVSIDLGRRCVGIDLSEDYLCNNAVVRIEGDLSGRPALCHLIGKTIKPVEGGRSLLR